MDTPSSGQAPSSAPVVVGVDGSACSTAALRWAALTAWQRGVPLRIVHAWSVPAAALTTPVMSGAFVDPAPFEEQGERILTGAAELVRSERGLRAPRIETVLTPGVAGSSLRVHAAGASLLVVGSHGRGAVATALLGSIADECLRHAEVPVVVVHGDGRIDHGDVVVGVDDSQAGRAALMWAALEAGRSGRRLIVVHAHDAPARLHPDLAGTADDADRRVVAASRAFVERLLTTMATTSGRPTAVSWRVAAGSPAATLLDTAANAALLVVGHSIDHGFAERLLGSVSRRCVHQAGCPVVVVPEPAEIVEPAETATDELSCAS